MKPKIVFLTAFAIGALGVSGATAQTIVRTHSTPRMSLSSSARMGSRWVHHHFGPHSRVFFDVGFGYPYGYPYGYQYYGYYPYDYGYYSPNQVVYDGVPVGANGSVAVEVQRWLARVGYYRGPIDGVIGAGTRHAIRSYQRARGLPVTGRIDDELLDAMDRG
ncbi:MAG TPA: peptidoglycan-binding domain-containing protein [Chthoniobacterales bacterium]|jgi:hypothetical protein